MFLIIRKIYLLLYRTHVKVTFCALLRGKNHLPYNVKSFCAKQKINRRRLKNCLAQNENPISEDGSECVRTLSLA